MPESALRDTGRSLVVPISGCASINRVVGCPNPFTIAKIDGCVPTGGTIAEMLDAAGVDPALMAFGRVHIVDWEMRHEPVPIRRELWGKVRPKPGMVIVIRAVSTGGGRGGGKNPLRILLSLAVIAVSYGVGQWVGMQAWAAGFKFGGVNILGALAGGATPLIGPPVLSSTLLAKPAA